MSDVFNLTPEEFHAQEDAERRAEQERREAAERAKQEAKLAVERKQSEQLRLNALRWRRWLTSIGACSGYGGTLEYEVRDTGNSFRPCDLYVRGVRVPVSEGMGSGMSLEIHLPWHTARYDSYRGRRERPESFRSRQKRDGSFNYDALGRMAARYARVELAHQAEEAAKMSAAGTVKRLGEELDYTNMEPSTDPAKPVRFKFSISRDMTEAEVRAAHAALRLAGLIR